MILNLQNMISNIWLRYHLHVIKTKNFDYKFQICDYKFRKILISMEYGVNLKS